MTQAFSVDRLSAFYFIIYILIGVFFLTAILLAIIVDSYWYVLCMLGVEGTQILKFKHTVITTTKHRVRVGFCVHFVRITCEVNIAHFHERFFFFFF